MSTTTPKGSGLCGLDINEDGLENGNFEKAWQEIEELHQIIKKYS